MGGLPNKEGGALKEESRGDLASGPKAAPHPSATWCIWPPSALSGSPVGGHLAGCAGTAAWPEVPQDSRCVWPEPGLGQWEGGKEGALLRRPASVLVPPPHAAPPLAQVVAIDLDEGLNGLVSYRMQVGMPRMDFLINSSSGVVVTTTELDRERIAEYQLRVVATDAGHAHQELHQHAHHPR